MEINLNDELGVAIKKLTLKQPFYGLFAMMLVKRFTNEIETMGVSIGEGMNYNLIINPEFFEKLTKEQRLTVTHHEILHIVFNHPLMTNMYSNHEVENIAADIEVNQYLDTNNLPENCCTLDKFPELGGKEKAGTKWYYDELMKNMNNPNSTISKLKQAGGLDGPVTITVTIGGDDQQVGVSEHSWEEATKDMSELEKEMIRAQCEHIIKEVANSVKTRGTVPGEIEEILKRLDEIKKSKFNWRAYIRRFAGNSTKSYIKGTRRKENKRIPGQPTVKVKFTQKLLVAIDTSSSVSSDELKEFLNEMTYLTKLGHEIDIIECDSKSHDVFKFNPKKDLPIFGRGGTDFQPPIDYYNENMKRYSCLIYFTDGECSAPENAHGNILWVLSQQSTMNNNLPGQVIKIEF